MMNFLAHIAALFALALEVCEVHSFSVVSPLKIATSRFHNHHHNHRRNDVHIIHQRSRDERMVAIKSQTNADVDSDEIHYPSAIFTQSAEEVYSLLVELLKKDRNSSGGLLLGLDDLKKGWLELTELIAFEELLPKELDQLYRKSLSSSDDDEKLDKKGFFALYQSIDALFELPDEDEDEAEHEIDNKVDQEISESGGSDIASGTDIPTQEEPSPSPSPSSSSETVVDPVVASSEIKANLVSYLKEITVNAKNKDKLPCGFDCTDAERQVIKDLVASLSTIVSPSNLVTSKPKMSEIQVMGEWDLLYTCSYAMLINRSLSGLGRTSSALAQFKSLRMRLFGNKYLGNSEYVEIFGSPEGETAFEVTITGEWYFEQKKSPYTGMPGPCLRMELEKVMYGPTTNGADQWSSLGPVKLTDIIFLDEDLMILQGNVNPSALFVYRKI
jgi:hypothetical protein